MDSEWPLIFAAVFILNVIPAFAPPTWMALSLIGFHRPQADVLQLALVCAVAASAGRVVLAAGATRLLRNGVMGPRLRENVGTLAEFLQRHRGWTVSGLLAYAFSPLPSNYLFIAYGIAALPLRYIVAPFFAGRLVSYAAWATVGQWAHVYLASEIGIDGAYMGGYFIVTQVLFIALIYVFTHLDWKALLREHRWRWVK